MKHAFPANRQGTVRVSFKQVSIERAVLIVSDDGVGFDPDRPSTGMGTRLLQALTRQLGGTLRYGVAEGTELSVEFAFAG